MSPALAVRLGKVMAPAEFSVIAPLEIAGRLSEAAVSEIDVGADMLSTSRALSSAIEMEPVVPVTDALRFWIETMCSGAAALPIPTAAERLKSAAPPI